MPPDHSSRIAESDVASFLSTSDDAAPLLDVTDLRTHIHTDHGPVRAVDGVSFTVDRGEAVCLVGESGSGKSVTCESLTGIVPSPPAEMVGGSVSFEGTSLHDGDTDLRAVRGDRIGHVFQNPQHALDPVYTVGEQLAEAVTVHRDVSDEAARDRAVELLGRVGIPNPAERVKDYPHEFSGGMRQRVALAIALAADPELLVADEPTTAVDVTVQARLLALLRDLLANGVGLLLVTHDLRVVAELADRVLVMFGGTIVERGPVEAVFERPAHPYTQALFDSYDGFARRPDRPARDDVPEDGCRFRAECPHAIEACSGPNQPPEYAVAGDEDHTASCVYYAEDRPADDLLADARAASPTEAEGDDD
ncbi:ABC transporter ATP-binding protein [Haloarcula amylovorans]|uniref:ABC transporter ATP-binding protein n=1 Tax=Haloarcula amylovorans TaxID=2562280 RepID=UPI00107636B6|nr:ABC transporter ATP-binding protein [Halomicroarcula amylolytica]